MNFRTTIGSKPGASFTGYLAMLGATGVRMVLRGIEARALAVGGPQSKPVAQGQGEG